MVTTSERERTSQPIFESSEKEIVLSIEGVSKKFCRDLKRSLVYGVRDIAGELVGFRGNKNSRLRKKEFWALNDINFELKRGEALGLVGKNGSGKSTLMRVIAGLIKPDIGIVNISGRVAPLIALGAGFNPVLTGKENIYANMSILGLSKTEIDDTFDDVVSFSGIGDAINSPLQTYSSGMAARLGFSSAIHTNPDILLIDEVLAVGDVKFRQKCFRKLNALREAGTSFILVSHNSQSILNVCHSAIYISEGNLITSGDTQEVISRYEEDLFHVNSESRSLGSISIPEKDSSESFGVDIVSVQFIDDQENIVDSPISGKRTTLSVGCIVRKESSNINMFVAVRELLGENDLVLHISSFNDNEPLSLSLGKQHVQIQLPYLCLKPGLYSLDVAIKEGSLYELDKLSSFRFKVISEESMSRCMFYQPREWKVAIRK